MKPCNLCQHQAPGCAGRPCSHAQHFAHVTGLHRRRHVGTRELQSARGRSRGFAVAAQAAATREQELEQQERRQEERARADPQAEYTQKTSNADAVRILGLGTWRLRGHMGPLFENLAAQIEAAWRHQLPALGLGPLPKEFCYCDTQYKGKTEMERLRAMRDTPLPQRGDADWPSLRLENRVYRSRVFHKLHLELAIRQDGLQVLHCVMFPSHEYDLPIFGLDLVARGNQVTLGIVDVSPASLDRSLPSIVAQTVQELQRKHGVENNRVVPEWGRSVFSDLCVMMKPSGEAELASFVRYCHALVQAYLQIARHVQPPASNLEARRAGVVAAHERYCTQQLQNSKTRQVLEAAFGGEFAERYMREVMFNEAG